MTRVDPEALGLDTVTRNPEAPHRMQPLWDAVEGWVDVALDCLNLGVMAFVEGKEPFGAKRRTCDLERGATVVGACK